MDEDKDRLMSIIKNLDVDELESIIWRLVEITGVGPALEKAEEISWRHTDLTPELVKDVVRYIVNLEPIDMRHFPNPYTLGHNTYDGDVGMVYLACSIREEFENDIAQMVNLGLTEEACLCLEAMSEAMGEVDSYFTQDQCNTIEWYQSLIGDCVEDRHPEKLFDMAEDDLNPNVLDAWGSGWR